MYKSRFDMSVDELIKEIQDNPDMLRRIAPCNKIKFTNAEYLAIMNGTQSKEYLMRFAEQWHKVLRETNVRYHVSRDLSA